MKKCVDSKLIFIKNGVWKIKEVGSSIFLDDKIDDIDNIDFSLGRIKYNLLQNRIMIEALSMGEFLGFEDSTYFLKEDEVNICN